MTSGSSPFSASNPIKVMVVDDSAVIRGFLVKILESCPDIEVKSIAANGLIAVNNLSKGKHDIIILDVEMPVMDGLSAIPRLLSIQPGFTDPKCRNHGLLLNAYPSFNN